MELVSIVLEASVEMYGMRVTRGVGAASLDDADVRVGLLDVQIWADVAVLEGVARVCCGACSYPCGVLTGSV